MEAVHTAEILVGFCITTPKSVIFTLENEINEFLTEGLLCCWGFSIVSCDAMVTFSIVDCDAMVTFRTTEQSATSM